MKIEKELDDVLFAVTELNKAAKRENICDHAMERFLLVVLEEADIYFTNLKTEHKSNYVKCAEELIEYLQPDEPDTEEVVIEILKKHFA